MKKSPNGLVWGIAAVLLWALLAAFSRTLLEQLGMFTAGGMIYIAGGLACFVLYPPEKRKFSLPYHGLCGFLLLAYFVLYSIGLGLAKNRVQAVEMGLINYLWPLLTLIFFVLFFKKKVSVLMMTTGILTAFAGFALSSSVLSGVPLTLRALWQNFCGNPFPYLMMTGAAFSWALYSNVISALEGKTPVDAMPYFMVISGVILWAMRYVFHESSTWSFSVLWQLVFMALFPIAGGYYCWDRAMLTPQREKAILFSYLTPLFSAIGSAIVLQLTLPWLFYCACLLVVAGALLCRYSIKDTIEK